MSTYGLLRPVPSGSNSVKTSTCSVGAAGEGSTVKLAVKGWLSKQSTILGDELVLELALVGRGRVAAKFKLGDFSLVILRTCRVESLMDDGGGKALTAVVISEDKHFGCG